MKVKFRGKTTGAEEGHSIVTEGSGHQGGTALPNAYAPTAWARLEGACCVAPCLGSVQAREVPGTDRITARLGRRVAGRGTAGGQEGALRWMKAFSS